MANVDQPFGFRPVYHKDGSPWNGKVGKYYVQAADATLIGIGDLVVIDGGADAVGVRSVTRAAANGVCLGPVVSVDPYPTAFSSSNSAPNLEQMHRSASTAAYVYVADDPDILMEAQEDGVGGAIAVTSMGLNANFIVAAGSSTTGLSNMEIDSSTAATTNTLPLKLESFVIDGVNEPGVANARILVSFNTHYFKSATGSTGV